MNKRLVLSAGIAVLVGLAGCKAEKETKAPDTDTSVSETVVETVVSAKPFDSVALTQILASQDDKAKARYKARNPAKTLKFFGITPGMTVVEALPGGGWYSKILIPYLGDEGKLVGVDYSIDMWPEFGGFADAEFIENKKTWAADWVEGAQEWRSGSEGDIAAFTFGARDTSMDGKADAVLFIRAMHNLSRFEEKGGYMSCLLYTSDAADD